ncbi:DUF6221 family protein [Streptomyces nigra]|uniref:DUF6221 family protein n=1 Tax=Streptomyces nigra TaxID=1827580 RepID=UPI0037D33AB4
MDDLVRWLGEQLDEDERIARAATWHDDAGAWTAHQSEYDSPRRSERRWFIMDSMDDGVITDVDPEASQPGGVARHVAEHDPARVLREIDAKRQLLNLHAPGETEYVDGDVCMACDVRGGAPFYPCKTLRLLALPYADRPGYREDWRP